MKNLRFDQWLLIVGLPMMLVAGIALGFISSWRWTVGFAVVMALNIFFNWKDLREVVRALKNGQGWRRKYRLSSHQTAQAAQA